MIFNSIDFLIFFPVVVIIYFLIPSKIRYIWLLFASFYFYMSWNVKYALLITFSIVITYLSGILIGNGKEKQKKIYMCLCIILNLLILVVFKYANFIFENIDIISNKFGWGEINTRLDLLLPVGISFYTFQALSYTIDVYRGRIKPEKNIFKYALFVSFFPQLVAGPIERSENLLPQIQNVDKLDVWNYERIKNGLLIMMYGFFQKLVIADRASIIVDNVINDYEKYGFVEIVIAVVLFAFQIYCDFGGYTNIAIGAAKVMGFDLMANFRQPYLARSIKDFWKRWHISLTTWFTDYLYIPLGGNRKGLARKYINILIVFGISGLWHGASWHFVIWGLLHAMYQIIEDFFGRIFKDRKRKENTNIIRAVGDRIIVFFLVDFAWLFFAADSVGNAVGVLKASFSGFHKIGISELGLDKGNCVLLFVAILFMLLVDMLREKQISILRLIGKQNIVIRWIVYMIGLWIILMLGIYGLKYDTSTFIYFQF